MMADAGLMQSYASLVTDQDLCHRVMDDILREYQHAQILIDELFGGAAAARRPRLAQAIRLRECALKPLHAEQVRLLAAWRKEPTGEKLQTLLLTVNAIAMGQKMTG
jgi:phosphoenolpyruvate carboxylase